MSFTKHREERHPHGDSLSRARKARGSHLEHLVDTATGQPVGHGVRGKGGTEGRARACIPLFPVRPHFSARVTTGLLSREACSQCVPQSDAPTTSADLSQDRLANCVTHISSTEVDTREPASKRGRSRRGHVATLRPVGRVLGAKPRPRRPGRQLGAGRTGGGGRGEVPTCSWWLSREQGDKARLANTEAAASWTPWLLQMVP